MNIGDGVYLPDTNCNESLVVCTFQTFHSSSKWSSWRLSVKCVANVTMRWRVDLALNRWERESRCT